MPHLAPNYVKELVQKFETHKDSYKSPSYNETQLRREFLDPLFTALGWDMVNKEGKPEAYKDVIHEDAIRIGEMTKAPDYCFRIGGARKYFLEAKKPFINLHNDPSPAYQVRRYSWSAKLPVGILSDFEELVIYDSRLRPYPGDKANKHRIRYYNYQDFISKWEEIFELISKTAVENGSLEKLVGETRVKGETVDKEFLKEMEGWREILAKDLASQNPNISVRNLNHVVQTIINRIVFLRISEDRDIEPYQQLFTALNYSAIWPRVDQLFQRADERYNSGLFDRKDAAINNVAVGDSALKEIISNLYPPNSPYAFSVIPAEILGHVYEQFLGKVIRLTSGHRAVVEEKPEVRKAGGIYYTPEYIVDYIVKQTVGKLLENKTPKEVSKLKILDPACGSGSFLLGAYQTLIDWHRDWYTTHSPEKYTKGKQPQIYKAGVNDWRLSTIEKKRILLNNIFGVDIDQQAVEVAKLSLLLKVMEGENSETINRQLTFWRERALPDLTSNIKCGNSLIGMDYRSNKQLGILDIEEKIKINAFDWGVEFADIINSGGFDTVIGNPPYIRIQSLQETNPEQIPYLKRNYRAANAGNCDIYVAFVEKGLSLLNTKGRLGFILPHKFFNSKYGQPLRALIAEGMHLAHIVHFGELQVFDGVTTYTCLFFLDKRSNKSFDIVRVRDLKKWQSGELQEHGTLKTKNLTSAEWNFIVGKHAGLAEKLMAIPQKLGDVADVFVGLQTSADDVFVLKMIQDDPSTLRLHSKVLGTDQIFEKQLLFPLVSGTDVNRYKPLLNRQYILFPYRVEKKVELIDFNFISKHYPRTAEYLLLNKKRLEDRESGRMRGSHWYGYIYLKNMTRQATEKLCVPRLVNRLYATYDANGTHFLDNVDVGGIVLKPEYKVHGLLFLLGLLNSRLLRWYFPTVSAPFRGGWLSANRQFISQLPICLPDLSDATQKTQHHTIVKLVERMLKLNEKRENIEDQREKEVLQREITETDRQIDQMVYKLYGLSDEEIKIIED